MRTLALTVAYDGTDWAGYQRQPERPSIQGVLERALTTALQHPIEIVAAGRTDAGVHALGQVISFTSDNPLPLDRLPRVLNTLLPASIRVWRAREKVPGFHARWWARFRRYRYVLQMTRWPDPIRGRFCWQISPLREVDAMARASRALLGRHDFMAFCHDRTPGDATVRTVTRVSVDTRPGGFILVDVQANAFLHQMVRLLVANLRLVGSGERPESWLAEVLASRNRHLAGKGAPPSGLFLMRIGYPVADDFSPTGEDAGDESHEEFSG